MTQQEDELVAALTQRFGALLSAAETREVLKFKTASGFWMARKRGQVQLEAIRIPGRKQFMYATEDVARLLARWKSSKGIHDEKGPPMV